MKRCYFIVLYIAIAGLISSVSALKYISSDVFSGEEVITPENNYCQNLIGKESFCDAKSFKIYSQYTDPYLELFEMDDLEDWVPELHFGILKDKSLKRINKIANNFFDEYDDTILRYVASILKARTEIFCAACLNPKLVRNNRAVISTQTLLMVQTATDNFFKYYERDFEHRVAFCRPTEMYGEKVPEAFDKALMYTSLQAEIIRDNVSMDPYQVATFLAKLAKFVTIRNRKAYFLDDTVYVDSDNNITMPNITNPEISLYNIRTASEQEQEIYFSPQINNKLPGKAGNFLPKISTGQKYKARRAGMIAGITLAAVIAFIILISLTVKICKKVTYNPASYSTV